MRRGGFSLFELMIVITLFATLALGTAVFAVQTIRANGFVRMRELMRRELVSARADTVNGTQDSAWGVMFLSNMFVRFQGTTYATRVQNYDRVTNYPPGFSVTGTTEVNFTRPEGAPVTAATIVLSQGTRTARITVNTMGTVQVQ